MQHTRRDKRLTRVQAPIPPTIRPPMPEPGTSSCTPCATARTEEPELARGMLYRGPRSCPRTSARPLVPRPCRRSTSADRQAGRRMNFHTVTSVGSKSIARLPRPKHSDSEDVAGRRVLAGVGANLIDHNMPLDDQLASTCVPPSPIAAWMINKPPHGGSDGSDAPSSDRTGTGLTVPTIDLGEIVDRIFGKDQGAPLRLAARGLNRNRAVWPAVGGARMLIRGYPPTHRTPPR